MTRLQSHMVLILVAFIWGTTFVAQKVAFVDSNDVATTTMGPITFTAIRFLLGALFIAPFVVREARRAETPLPRRAVRGGILLGFILVVASITQQIGIISTTVTNAGFLTILYVPMVPILALALFRMWPRPAVWPAAAGCVLGTYFLNGGTLTAFSTGDLWVLASVLFWALHVIMIGRLVMRDGRALMLAFTQAMVAGIIAAIAAIASETIIPAALLDAWFEIIYAGVFSVGVAYTLQIVAQRYSHPATAAIILSTEMIFAALSGAIVLGERLSVMGLVGCALILASVVLVEISPYVFVKARKGAMAGQETQRNRLK